MPPSESGFWHFKKYTKGEKETQEVSQEAELNVAPTSLCFCICLCLGEPELCPFPAILFKNFSLCRENVCVVMGPLIVFLRKIIIAKHTLKLFVKMRSLMFMKPINQK